MCEQKHLYNIFFLIRLIYLYNFFLGFFQDEITVELPPDYELQMIRLAEQRETKEMEFEVK
jgi:hypothetical protein